MENAAPGEETRSRCLFRGLDVSKRRYDTEVALREAHQAAGLGDYRRLQAELLQADPGDPWLAAAKARYGLVVPSPDQHLTLNASGADPEALEYARFDHLLGALLRLEKPVINEMAQAALSSSGEVFGLIHLWQRLFTGDLKDGLESICEPPMGNAIPELRIVHLAARALLHLEHGLIEDALRLARQASRMARSEGVLCAEYLANIVLARTRRASGLPHLAGRILRTLHSVMPESLMGWLRWEMSLCAMPLKNPTNISVAMAALQANDLTRFRSACVLGEADTPDFVARDGRDVQASFDVLATCEQTRVEGWCKLEEAALPAAVVGLCDVELEADAVAYVVVSPNRLARRVMRQALNEVANVHRLQDSSRSHIRADAAICALAQASTHGLDDPHLFFAVYGFEYEQERHGATLRQLIQRVRARLEEFAEVTRAEHRYQLTPARDFAVPDPRCALQLDEHILRSVATSSDPVSAKDVASRLHVALRTVQVAFRRLLDEGACTTERIGRTVAYRVEDTTFQEPTLSRLEPSV